MIKEAIDRILSLSVPNFSKFGDLNYSDKSLQLITPPQPHPVECSTLQGFVDLYQEDLDDVKPDEILVQIVSPTEVDLISKESDAYGRRRVWVSAEYPECKSFPFGVWQDPENFIIAAQQHFQRVKIEKDDGTFAKDLEYILSISSKISTEHTTDHDDDGFTQRVAVKQGAVLKTEQVLKPLVMLAPYRTFAEIDQVVSNFVFRARVGSGLVSLALFEGDGGRWKISAIAAIKAWLQPKFGDVPVIS